MQTIAQVMTRNVRVVSPQESVQRAAQLMDELNVGSLPVCDGQRLVGMVTDRDITVRATAAGRAPGEAHVGEVMSTDLRWCYEDEVIADVAKKMAGIQIGRVPVISHDNQRRLVGIVALGDLRTSTSRHETTAAAARISTPSEPDRSPGDTGRPAQEFGHEPRVSGIAPEGSSSHAGEATRSSDLQPGAYAAGS